MALTAFNSPATRGVITLPVLTSPVTGEAQSVFVQAENPIYAIQIIVSGASPSVAIQGTLDDPQAAPTNWVAIGSAVTANAIIQYTGHLSALRFVVSGTGTAQVTIRMPYPAC